jgi:hypothetical protein
MAGSVLHRSWCRPLRCFHRGSPPTLVTNQPFQVGKRRIHGEVSSILLILVTKSCKLLSIVSVITSRMFRSHPQMCTSVDDKYFRTNLCVSSSIHNKQQLQPRRHLENARPHDTLYIIIDSKTSLFDNLPSTPASVRPCVRLISFPCSKGRRRIQSRQNTTSVHRHRPPETRSWDQRSLGSKSYVIELLMLNTLLYVFIRGWRQYPSNASSTGFNWQCDRELNVRPALCSFFVGGSNITRKGLGW